MKTVGSQVSILVQKRCKQFNMNGTTYTISCKSSLTEVYIFGINCASRTLFIFGAYEIFIKQDTKASKGPRDVD